MKTDYFYSFEKKLMAINFNNPDKSKVARNLIVALNHDLCSIIEYLGENKVEE